MDVPWETGSFRVGVGVNVGVGVGVMLAVGVGVSVTVAVGMGVVGSGGWRVAVAIAVTADKDRRVGAHAVRKMISPRIARYFVLVTQLSYLGFAVSSTWAKNPLTIAVILNLPQKLGSDTPRAG